MKDHSHHNETEAVPDSKNGELSYSCPMHPNVIKDKPGMCPECGMNLVPVKKTVKHKDHNEDDGFNKHEGHHTNIFKRKFWVSFILTIPVLAYAPLIQEFLDYQAPEFPGSEYLPVTLSTVIFFYGGWVFLASAYRELKAKLPGMMTLIALAITTAYVYSVAVVFIGEGETLFWELATLITIMLLGHWLEMRAVSGAQSALKELSKLLPDEAEVIRDGKTHKVPLSELVKGDLVLVKPGGRVPTDGMIKEGASHLDESIATGESKPVSKKKGDEVIAGTTNGDGSLKVQVSKIGEETFLAGVMRLVAEAQSSKSRLQMLSDRAAFYLTVIAVVTGGITVAAWLSLSTPAFAITRLVTVLVIACPHALGLAIPLVASISTTKAASNGFLVKQRLALEAARNVGTVLFDKTGTLTKGEFGVADIVSVSGKDDSDILRMAASINQESEHPIAKAIVKDSKKKNIPLSPIKKFTRIAGKGASAILNGKALFVGSEALLKEKKIKVDADVQKKIDLLSSQGKTVIFLLSEKALLGAIALADVIREESREAIKTLHSMNIRTAMITGDSEDVAKWVAGELGIDEYFSRVLPDQKSEKVKLLQEKGQKVAMVGDGVNDAPALTRADLGIAIGAGTNVALESAGIILVRNDPRDIPRVVKLSRLTYRKMMQNLFWATGYNVVAIPLAAGVLASQGILLEPALGAVFMSLSTVIVAFNALLLRRASLETA